MLIEVAEAAQHGVAEAAQLEAVEAVQYEPVEPVEAALYEAAAAEGRVGYGRLWAGSPCVSYGRTQGGPQHATTYATRVAAPNWLSISKLRSRSALTSQIP